MGLKRYKPTTPTRRYMITEDFEEVTKTKPEKSLLEPDAVKASQSTA